MTLQRLASYINPKIKEFQKSVEYFEEEELKAPNVQKAEFAGWTPKTIFYGKYAAFSNSKGEITSRKVDCPKFNAEALSFGKKRKAASERAARMCLALLDLQKYDRSNHFDRATELPLPITSKKFTDVLGNSENVSLAISNLISIGVLQEFRENYTFVSEGTKFPKMFQTRSKSYLLHYYNEMKFRDYCRAMNLPPWTKKENKRKSLAELSEAGKELSDGLDDYEFNQRTNIKRRRNETVPQCEERVKRNLLSTYPMLGELLRNISEFNSLQKDDCRKLKAEPNLTWNSKKTKIKSIGIRATCELCSAPKKWRPSSRLHSLPWKDRQEALSAMGLVASERDVKSSVPRLGRFLNTGLYPSQDEDCYKEIFDIAKSYESPDNPFLRESWNEANRKAMKSLFMLANFSSSYKKADAGLKWNMRRSDAIYGLSGDELQEQRNYIKYCKMAIDEYTGGMSQSSAIFLYESCVCVSAALRLARKGMQVFLCYDGFYSDSPISEEEFNKIIREEYESFKRKYPNLFKNSLCKNNYKYVSYSNASNHSFLNTFKNSIIGVLNLNFKLNFNEREKSYKMINSSEKKKKRLGLRERGRPKGGGTPGFDLDSLVDSALADNRSEIALPESFKSA